GPANRSNRRGDAASTSKTSSSPPSTTTRYVKASKRPAGTPTGEALSDRDNRAVVHASGRCIKRERRRLGRNGTERGSPGRRSAPFHPRTRMGSESSNTPPACKGSSEDRSASPSK